jgi:hypothetical protein
MRTLIFLVTMGPSAIFVFSLEFDILKIYVS